MFKIGGEYNWKNQPERLIYLGNNFSGNGYWHQFAKVESPSEIWCECKDSELQLFEESSGPHCWEGGAKETCDCPDCGRSLIEINT